MRVIVTGATGFIGRALCRALQEDCELVALSRDVGKAAETVGPYAKVVEWDARTTGGWTTYVDGADAVVSLAGENVGSGRWTTTKRNDILQSRINSAGAVVGAVIGARSKPAVVVQASAIGYYGSRGDEVLEERCSPGSGHLAHVCHQVESIAAKIETAGVRSVRVRTGVVLGVDGGALPRLIQPFRLHLGGHLGTGRQWFSWISLADEIRAIRFLIEGRSLRGPFNLTSPNPVMMRSFCKTLGEVLNKPAWTAVPGFAVRLALGEMADEVVLASQKVVPKRLLDAGFEFRHPDVRVALTTIIRGETGNESCQLL